MPLNWLVRRIRRTTRGKAGGPDDIINDLLKLDPEYFAALLHPLFVKIGLDTREPLALKGGWAVE
eukprot:3998862-Pyramimonas_sp.AAC.1